MKILPFLKMLRVRMVKVIMMAKVVMEAVVREAVMSLMAKTTTLVKMVVMTTKNHLLSL
jgi:hypothetical protein